MSLYPRLVTAIHSLPLSTLRPKPFPQLTEALQGFVDRAYGFPVNKEQASAGPQEVELGEQMLAALERLKSDAALREVCTLTAGLHALTDCTVSTYTSDARPGTRPPVLLASLSRGAQESQGRRPELVQEVFPASRRRLDACVVRCTMYDSERSSRQSDDETHIAAGCHCSKRSARILKMTDSDLVSFDPQRASTRSRSSCSAPSDTARTA